MPNAAIAPSLGRNLSGGAPIAVIDVVEPGTFYGDRITDLDVRVAKVLRFGGRRLMVGVDIHNVLNTDAVLGYNQFFGPAFMSPTVLIQPQFAKFTAQFDF